MNGPVWLYWEGALPDWIAACRQTIFAHCPDVRLLDWITFDQLWDSDRDLDIHRLSVAHRADFIRAFLLARFGGLWIDSDCLVMRDLQPVFDLLDEYDFVAHAERQGHISNGFIAAAPDGVIARAYYKRLCEIMRSGRELSWLTLGADLLTATLNDSRIPWYRLGYELVQPVCWSNPQQFFRVAEATEHARVFNPRSLCYMLSNNTVQGYAREHATVSLMDAGTFFRFLLQHSLEARQVEAPARRTSVGSSNWQQIPFCVQALLDVAPSRVLDIGVGFGRWGMLVREFCEEWQGRVHRENWTVWLEGVEAFPSNVEEYHHLFYNWIHITDALPFLRSTTDHWDLVILGDVLQEWPKLEAQAVLELSLQAGTYVLLNLPLGPGWIQGPTYGNPYEEHRSSWSLDDLLPLEPVQFATFTEYLGRDYGAFLFSREDPAALRGKRREHATAL